MNAPMFGHGQLRLYLLTALADGAPMSGYDLIRALERQFDGLYTPSAGTVYPRLAKLEEEGLISREDEGRKSVYSITEAGRAELVDRAEEVEGLRHHVASSSERLADDLHRRVAEGAAHITSILGSAAAAARAEAEAERNRRSESSGSWDEGSGPRPVGDDTGGRTGGSSRDPFFGLSFEGIEKLAQEIGRADRFRAEHAEDLSSLAELARSRLLGPNWGAGSAGRAPTGPREHGGSTDDLDEAAGTDESAIHDAVIDDAVIDVEIVGDDTQGDERVSDAATDHDVNHDVTGGDATPAEAPATHPADRTEGTELGADEVRRIIGILRTAADQLEDVLPPDPRD